jgi:tetratricopeptide (TPR) repeat protein
MNITDNSLNNDVNRRVAEAQIYYKNGKFQEALDVLEALMPSATQHPVIYPMLGALYNQLGRDQDAVAAFFAGTIANPNNPTQYYNLGLVCRKKGLLFEAIESFTTAVRLNGEYEQAHLALKASIAEREQKIRTLSVRLAQAKTAGDYQAASEICTTILKLQPEHLAANNAEADRLEKAGEFMAAYQLSHRMATRYPQATAFVDRCERLDSRVGNEFRIQKVLTEGKKKFQARDLVGTKQTAELALQSLPYSTPTTQPLRAEALLLLGLVQEANNEHEQAKEFYLQALSCDQSCNEAQQCLLRIQRREVATKRSFTSAMLSGAQVLRKKGDFRKALQVLDQAHEIYADDPLLQLLRGQCFKDLGQINKAVMTLEHSVKLNGEFKPAINALRHIRLQYDAYLHKVIAESLLRAQKLYDAGSYHLSLDELMIANQSASLRRRNAFNSLQPIGHKKICGVLEAQERAFFNLQASNYEAIVNFPLAIKTYEELLSLQPHSRTAMQIYRQAKIRQNDKVKFVTEQAIGFRAAQNYSSSITKIQEAFKIDPRSVSACLHMAVTLECARQSKEAMLFYETALKLHPKPDQINHLIVAARERAKKWPIILQRSPQVRAEHNANIALGRQALTVLPRTLNK